MIRLQKASKRLNDFAAELGLEYLKCKGDNHDEHVYYVVYPPKPPYPYSDISIQFYLGRTKKIRSVRVEWEHGDEYDYDFSEGVFEPDLKEIEKLIDGLYLMKDVLKDGERY